MKKLHLLGASLATGVVAASAFAIPAAAWHPKGQIKKSVQNVTSNSELSDANDVNTGLTAKTGDTLKYVIEVSNTGAAASNGNNDMVGTVLTDTLPEGVELVSDPAERKITEDLGVLKPGQKVTKEYTVKVTADQDKTILTNKACFTGDSAVNDNPQSGCDNAVVTVTVPQTSSTHTEEKQPAKGEDTPRVESAVTTLPETGMGGVAGIFTGISGLGYAAHRFVAHKRR